MSEYEKCYLAIPVRGDLEWAIALSLFMMVDETRFRSDETNDRYWNPHLTLKYFGQLNEEGLMRIVNSMRTHADLLHGSHLQIVGPGIIGKERRAFVYKVKKTERLEKFERKISEDLPEYREINLPFNPHLTIAEIRNNKSLRRARKFITSHNGSSVTFSPQSVAVFTRDKRRRTGVRLLDEVRL